MTVWYPWVYEISNRTRIWTPIKENGKPDISGERSTRSPRVFLINYFHCEFIKRLEKIYRSISEYSDYLKTPDQNFHRKLTRTKISFVRREAALRPTYFQWKFGRFVFSSTSFNELVWWNNWIVNRDFGFFYVRKNRRCWIKS